MEKVKEGLLVAYRSVGRKYVLVLFNVRGRHSLKSFNSLDRNLVIHVEHYVHVPVVNRILNLPLIPSFWLPSWNSKRNFERCYFPMFLFSEAHNILPGCIFGIISILDIISVFSVVVQAMMTS